MVTGERVGAEGTVAKPKQSLRAGRVSLKIVGARAWAAASVWSMVPWAAGLKGELRGCSRDTAPVDAHYYVTFGLRSSRRHG